MGNFKQLLALALIMCAGTTFARNIERRDRDIKLPSQVMIDKQSFKDPAAASANAIAATTAGATSAAAASLTSFSAQPDLPRNIVITPAGTTGDVESCVITVSGKNIRNANISETFTFAADASTAQTGSKAFKSITSVAWPASCESGSFAATWNIGYGEKLGMRSCMDGNYTLFSNVSGTKETTAATVAYDNDELEKNTADFNGTMNGSADFDLFYFSNYRCD